MTAIAYVKSLNDHALADIMEQYGIREFTDAPNIYVRELIASICNFATTDEVLIIIIIII